MSVRLRKLNHSRNSETPNQIYWRVLWARLTDGKYTFRQALGIAKGCLNVRRYEIRCVLKRRGIGYEHITT